MVVRRRGARRPDGFYLTPAVVADVDNAMRIAREEIFGPVASVIPFDDEDDADPHRQRQRLRPVRLAVDRQRHPGHPRRQGAAHRHAVGEHATAACASETPFGGFKRSGLGRELGMAAMDHYTEVKNVFFSEED